jgi:hypothetical protein
MYWIAPGLKMCQWMGQEPDYRHSGRSKCRNFGIMLDFLGFPAALEGVAKLSFV